jgi:ubiquitin-protein ligase
MLEDPATDSPLEADIARQLAEDKPAFDAEAAKWTKEYATQ